MDHIQPGRFFRNRGATTFSYHVSQPSKALGGRPAIVQTGKCLGGGSSVNCMNISIIHCGFRGLYLFQALMYTRAAASDYDDWENLYANPGWGSKELIPLAKKV
jgi:alcohol oxidase